LKRIGCHNIRFIPRTTRRTPDLEATLGSKSVLCEVKTLNRSIEALRARRSVPANGPDLKLNDGFFAKLRYHIDQAVAQMSAYDPAGYAKHMVYINPRFDDLWGHRGSIQGSNHRATSKGYLPNLNQQLAQGH
jgi:hypothetical protein